MPDKKLTDQEIIKALEYCATNLISDCKKCPLRLEDGTTQPFCTNKLIRATLDLINRLQEENERLKGNRHCSTCKHSDLRADQQPCVICAGYNKYEPSLNRNNIKAEAYKEFAEMLKERAYLDSGITGFRDLVVDAIDIDNLLNELVGEADA